MYKIYILGMGPGAKELICPKSISLIKSAQIVIGAKRHFQEVKEEIKNKKQVPITKNLTELVNIIKDNKDKKIAVLVSGDPGFYSLLAFLRKHFLKEQLEVIAGISSIQYMFCKLALPWQNAKIKSLHGKSFNYVKALKKHNLVAMLTDKINTPQFIANELISKGYGKIQMYIGENLSYKNEKITQISAKELIKIDKEFEMNIVILQKEQDVSY